MHPLARLGVEVGLGGGVAQGVVAHPRQQVDVEDLGRDETLSVHQATGRQLTGGQEAGA